MSIGEVTATAIVTMVGDAAEFSCGRSREFGGFKPDCRTLGTRCAWRRYHHHQAAGAGLVQQADQHAAGAICPCSSGGAFGTGRRALCQALGHPCLPAWPGGSPKFEDYGRQTNPDELAKALRAGAAPLVDCCPEEHCACPGHTSNAPKKRIYENLPSQGDE